MKVVNTSNAAPGPPVRLSWTFLMHPGSALVSYPGSFEICNVPLSILREFQLNPRINNPAHFSADRLRE